MLSLVFYLCVFFPLLGLEFLSFFKNLCDQIKKSSKWHLKCLMLSVFSQQERAEKSFINSIIKSTKTHTLMILLSFIQHRFMLQ